MNRWWFGSARKRRTASRCGGSSNRWLASRTRPSSPGARCLMSTSGGQVDTDRPKSLVQRIEGELHDLAFGVAVLGDEPRIGRVESSGDEGKTLDECLLNQWRVALWILANGLMQDLDPEVHVARFVARDRGESAVETTVGELLLAHRL